MFLELSFFLLFILVSNFSVTINSLLFTFLFLKSLLFLPNLSFYGLITENSFIFIDKIGFILFILAVFSVLIIFITNRLFPPFFIYLNKVLFGSLIFVFITSNLLMFYFFFEITIIPTIIIIIIWGYQPERLQAAFYFFFYTILASLPLLIFVLYYFTKNKTYFIGYFSSSEFFSFWWIVIILAFLVKFPIFFFHLWLPKAHVEAPLGGSIILAAVLLKLGGIGIFRIIIIIKSFVLSPIISTLSIWGRVLTALICLQQRDIKAIIAYSSVAHIRFLISRMFLGTDVGLNGRAIIIFFHGISRASLFMLAKITYDFTNSRSLILSKGKINIFPIFRLFWALIITVNIGIPPARRFWAELFLIFGFTFKRSIYLILFFLIAFFSTVYSCFLIVRIHHGKIMSKINYFQAFSKQNYCPIFIFTVISYLLFLCPSFFFIN